jgi:surfactin synthase thioesterase subunit
VTSSIRYAPIEKQYPAWRLLRSLVRGEEASNTTSGLPNRLCHTKILLLVGEEDSILPKDQLCRNSENILGSENLEIIGFNGGHSFPITQGVKVAESICRFWEL